MTTPSAGWYPDPDGSPRFRWWNGIAWTDSYSDAQAATPAAAPIAPIEPVAPVSPTAPYTSPVSPAGSYPASAESSPYLSAVGAPMTAPAGTPWNTVWIWLLVFVPLLPSIGLLFIDFRGMFSYASLMNGASASASLMTSPAYLFVALSGWVIYGLSVLFAFLDYRELSRRGVPSPFHWAFAFISSIVYVIGRSVVVRRRTGKGISPMWVSIVSYVVTSVIVTAYLVWVMVDAFQRLR